MTRTVFSANNLKYVRNVKLATFCTMQTANHAQIPIRDVNAETVQRMGVNVFNVLRDSLCALSPKTNVQNARIFSHFAYTIIKHIACNV